MGGPFGTLQGNNLVPIFVLYGRTYKENAIYSKPYLPQNGIILIDLLTKLNCFNKKIIW